MQIISGKYKGHKLKHPKNIRPITQKNKKMIIDTLQQDIVDARVIDLYAGSGQIGLEALSNGAQHVTFVEADRQNINIISTNINTCQIDHADYSLENTQVSDFIKHASEVFDIIVVDPPHFTVDWSDLLLIDKICHSRTILTIKYDQHRPPPDMPNFQLLKTKGAKDNLVNFYLHQA